MKVAIIGTVGVPAKYGGFETLAEQLTRLATEFGHDLTIYCSSLSYEKKLNAYKNAKLKYVPLKANGWQSIFYDLYSIIHASIYSDILIVLGGSAGIFIPLLERILPIKIVVNTDGIEWRREKWNIIVKVYLKFSEFILLKYGKNIISDNLAITKYYSDRYKRHFITIPYGGDHITKSTFRDLTSKFGNYAINISRTVPENNIHTILEAFSVHVQYNLVILGDWNSSEYGRVLKDMYKDCSNIYMLPPLYESETLKNELRNNCIFYVHGHSAGGSSPGLIEAMCLSKPILSFDTPSNRATTHGQAVYYKNTDDLGSALCFLTAQDFTYIAKNMEEIASKCYTWNIIAQSYNSYISKLQ